MLIENYNDVNEKVNAACKKVGRNRDEVTLIAVSKTKPAENIAELYEYGVRDFGENKVQEMVEKYELLPKDIRWHLIGHLQTNKVKYIVDKVHLIHSVDSVKLAEQIEKEAAKKGVIVNILVQVNVANEETKFGLDKDETIKNVEAISKFEHIRIKGLMTIAPFVEDSEENRKYFNNLKQLSVDIQKKNIDNVDMDFLSMGMSGDFETAIEEGATLIRVGTSIFGMRNYNN
ncbi:MAG: YggS family pyridoxal phosphate-dependent enzyme [Lachnospiraceae bacterium]|nr:YggS family pyridoxal phosphate-dependent enzyme [Lachnospiraceae bacterium]